MAQVVCSRCSNQFEASNHLVTTGAAAAGAAVGAYFGPGVGIAMGPLGAIAGTVPGAIIGGTIASLGITKFTRCPSCGHVFMI